MDARHDILEIGKKIVKKASEFSFIKMEISMKVCGVRIRDMDRVPTGVMRTANLNASTLVTGLKTRSMVEVHFSIRIETDMTVIGSVALHKEKGG